MNDNLNVFKAGKRKNTNSIDSNNDCAFIIKNAAEDNYKKPFNELTNVINEKEVEWGEAKGKESW